MKTEGNTLVLTPAEAMNMSNALADGLCFLSGFEMARESGLPFELLNLRNACRELNGHLKDMQWPVREDAEPGGIV